jgi:putative ABC transport system ATP-binding protein
MAVGNKKVLIKATNINQQFQVGDELIKPLNDVSFSILENTFNIIFGPSGSGKSTLLNVLTGLQYPTSGTVLFDDKNVYKLHPDELAHFRANRIGIMYQVNYWVKSLSVLDNVSLPLYFLGHSRSSASKLAMDALAKIGMEKYAKKYPSLLSGGEQQRVALARALASDPMFVIADEPTGSLDSKNGDKVMALLRQCQTEFNRTIILVTHNMEYLPLADNLLKIQDGQVVQMPRENISKATDAMISEIKQRIDRLSKMKENDGRE